MLTIYTTYFFNFAEPVVSPYLEILTNLLFPKEVFPAQPANAKFIPLSKKGSELDKSIDRPISFLCVMSGELHECVMYNRLYSYFEKFDI